MILLTNKFEVHDTENNTESNIEILDSVAVKSREEDNANSEQEDNSDAEIDDGLDVQGWEDVAKELKSVKSILKKVTQKQAKVVALVKLNITKIPKLNPNAKDIQKEVEARVERKLAKNINRKVEQCEELLV